MSMNTQNGTPVKSLEEKFEELIEEYKKEKNSNDFLLFDLANANENAHTKVLLWLLSYKENGKYIFLPSFLKLLNISYETCENYNASDQKTAIGNKGTGFIDLYIEGEGNKIIIENKIYGAADTERQLARYVATALDKTEEEFVEWYNMLLPTNKSNTITDNLDNIYVVYLTADGTKYPDDRRKDETNCSFPNKLGELLNDRFIPINYTDHILPWLEDEYENKNNWNKKNKSGLIQYIEYLKYFLSAGEVSKVVKTYVSSYNDFIPFMKDIKSLYHKYGRKAEGKGTIIPLFKDMMSASESEFFKNLRDDWHVHVLLNSIILYKESWAELDERKYTIPTLHLVASNSNYLNNNGECDKLKWRLEVDHLNVDGNKIDTKKSKYDYSNHDKTFWFKLDGLKLINFEAFEDNNNDIKKIDIAIEEYKESNPSGEDNPNSLLDMVYNQLIK